MALHLRHLALAVAATALAALAGCVRSGPPAPVVMGGDTGGPSRAAPVATVVRAPERTVTRVPERSRAPTRHVAKAKPALPVAAPQTHRHHPDHITVTRGETLYMISRRYDVPLRSIIDANDLDPPFRVKAGARLTLPQTRFHVVRAGETLYAISRLYDVDVSTLARLNHLDEPYAIRSGETLYLPASVEPAETTARAAIEETPNSASVPSRAPRALALPGGASGAPAAPVPPRKPNSERGRGAAELASRTPPPSRRLSSHGFAWPLEGRILEAYGTGPAGTHNDGINIAARAGEPVRAAASGVVAYVGDALRGYGNLVLIKHRDGYMTAYAHNARLLVRRGQKVKRGQEIATAGATGSVRAPQLHFEIRRGTHALDPIDYLPSLRASAD